MPATASTRTTRTTLRRGVVAAAALPLLIGALASCGYGSEAKKDDGDKAANAAADGAKLSASEVRIGYFPNLTHATA
ncbi:sulfate ABC transporter substrate-binding protein, partial [Streptomyces sp. NPDC048424]